MKKVITSEKIPIKVWSNNIEENTLEQAKNLANLPFAKKWISLMPDSHLGYGMPIGGVVATKEMIIPNAVGVDIGCGMCAVKTSLKNIDTETLKKIMGEIRKVIPVGFNKHKEMQNTLHMPRGGKNLDKTDEKYFEKLPKLPIVSKEYENARKSIGTLGGGNHFIEIQKGDDGHIWIMIHSGSRNLGKQVADYYNKIAVKLNKKWHSLVPKEWELAFLPIDSEEGQSYIREMNYCVDFALANRELMMNRIEMIIAQVMNLPEKTFDVAINIAHNYAKMENHFGENLLIHRKGATLATKKTIGIIPGSQGSKSYIVKGKENSDSFNSCSHGAGRKMGRKEAERTLDLEKEKEMLNNQGIIHSIRGKKDLDEAPSAYKPIEEVMKNQEDLIEIITELTPLAVIKG